MAQAVLVELFSKTKYQNDFCLHGAHDFGIPARAFHEGSHTQRAAPQEWAAQSCIHTSRETQILAFLFLTPWNKLGIYSFIFSSN